MDTTLFFLEAKCVYTGYDFYPRYDFAADDCWVLTYGEKTLPPGQTASANHDQTLKVEKRRVGPQYKCPWCGNNSFVRCGKCRKITCYNNSLETFTCAHCGNKGRISGIISESDMKGMVKSSGSGQ